MTRFLFLSLSLAIFICAAEAKAADEEKPYGRVCISIFDPSSGKEEPFKSSMAYSEGATVKAYIEANSKCTVVLAALTKEGKLANDWRPQFSELREEFEEIQLPTPPGSWDWSKTSEPFDLYVCFLAPGAKEIEEAKRLIAAMQPSKVDKRLLSMQTNKLRELIGRIATEKEKVNHAPKTEPEMGGVLRGTPLGTAFPWRLYAQNTYFVKGHAGVLIFSSGKPIEENSSTPTP